MQLSLPRLPLQRQQRLQDIFHHEMNGIDDDELDFATLADRARWIRDDLDLQVAVHGPNVLSPDNVVVLYQMIEQLRRTHISASLIRRSRIHYAVLLIAGRATRWPSKIIDEADALIEEWARRYGPLHQLRPPLYEDGGRLFGVSTPLDFNKEILNVKWVKQFGIHSRSALRTGSLGFEPGE